MLGTLIKDRYRIEKELGRGGFGAVYLARDTQLMDRAVVVKILLDPGAGEGWYKRKFEQEIEALSRIHHPGVVSVVDAGESPEGQPYLVLQFVEGTTLREAIQPGGMDLPRAAAILRKVGQALHAAHEKGVVHRDLKPDNIMLRPQPGGDEHITIIDFGIASVNEAQAPAANTPEKTKVTGTFTYMAPEQFEGRPTAASDIYALGVIAFEMLAGAPPSAGKPLFELMLMQKEGTWPKISELRPSVPATAEQAIGKALSRDPDVRFGSAREFGDGVADALESAAGATADHPGSPRSRAVVWLLVTIALAGILAASLMLPRRAGSPAPENSVAVTPQPQAERLFTYWITGQHFVDGDEDGPPFVLAREGAFRSGDKINIEIEFAQSGHFYAINQAPEKVEGIPLYSSLFPSLNTKDRSSAVRRGQYLKLPEGDRFQFTSAKGVEYVWFVFSPEPLSTLAGLPPGPVKNLAKLKKLREFFEKQQQPPPVLETDPDARRTVVRTRSAVAVLKIELSHR